jgi:hypothetical protein
MEPHRSWSAQGRCIALRLGLGSDLRRARGLLSLLLLGRLPLITRCHKLA